MNSDRFARVQAPLVVLVGLVNLAFAGYAMVNPMAFTRWAGLDDPQPVVLSELRAVYGGLLEALGLALLAAPTRKAAADWYRVLGLLFVGLVAGRGFGWIMDGFSNFTGYALAFEAGSAWLLLWASVTASRNSGGRYAAPKGLG